MKLQKKPTDEQVKDYYHRRLSDYETGLFYGHEIIEKKPKYGGDYRHIHFFDKTVVDKIKPNVRYKCWFDYSTPSDPSDCSSYYYIVYIEEVPKKWCMCEAVYKLFQKYVNEK